jgi:acidic leucine-rich nuclear phosphoprotein 32 family protein A/C/D|tara:strand:- start:382 stop:834 length:453 start_codon:yes stop_codon:yes gene_type:complete
MDLEAAIAAQTKDTPSEQVTELVLDTCKATKVSGLEKFSNLKSLTLNGCGLTTLEGFPTLPELRRLELSDNNISEGLEALQDAALFQLKSLSLAGNKFATLEDLDPLVRPLSALAQPLCPSSVACTAQPMARCGVCRCAPTPNVLLTSPQ